MLRKILLVVMLGVIIVLGSLQSGYHVNAVNEPPSGNLITNPDFETGNTNGWSVNGTGTIAVSTKIKIGAYSLIHTRCPFPEL